MMRYAILIHIIAFSAYVFGQDYQAYEEYADGYQDNLYADYAMRQQDKTTGAAPGGPGFAKLLAVGAVGWIAGGKFHSSRASKNLKKKHMKEQKTLYSQYYNDVYKLQEQNAELAYVIEKLQVALQTAEQDREMDKLQRDYDEFKQPDIDGDDRISRAEFNMYVNNYLKNYPGLTEKDYPRFEDFDHDGDGYVSFKEYAEQMALQVKQAEQDMKRAQQSGSSASVQKANAKANAVKGLYGEAKQKDSFNDLYTRYRG